jgi:hypothetical protein
LRRVGSVFSQPINAPRVPLRGVLLGRAFEHGCLSFRKSALGLGERDAGFLE